MIVYTDSSAVLKRVVAEPESSAVRGLLRERHTAGDLLVGSALAWVELTRALTRAGVDEPHDMTAAALSGVDEFPLSPVVLERARTVGPATLRSLDAIHLASAVLVGADAVLTYDDRLAEAVRTAGIQVWAPPA